MILRITEIIFILFIVFFIYKLVRCNRPEEKLFYFNVISVKIILLLTVISVDRNDLLILDISVTSAIIGFLVISIFVRYLNRG